MTNPIKSISDAQNSPSRISESHEVLTDSPQNSLLLKETTLLTDKVTPKNQMDKKEIRKPPLLILENDEISEDMKTIGNDSTVPIKSPNVSEIHHIHTPPQPSLTPSM